jgi:hypothetical protein
VRALAGVAQLVFVGLVLATAVQAVDVFAEYHQPQPQPPYPVEADTPIPEQLRFVVACRDTSTGLSRLIVGGDARDMCPDGFTVVFVPPQRVYPVSPSPAPS